MNNASRFVSFLDLMCCGFGGAVLLFLIVASARPQSGEAGQLILVRCRHVAGSKAEVGIEFRPPGETRWFVATAPPAGANVVSFAAASHPNSGAESFLLLSSPPAGRWEFRSYLIDFPDTGSPSRPEPLQVELRAYGARVRRQHPVRPLVRLTQSVSEGPGMMVEVAEVAGK